MEEEAASTYEAADLTIDHKAPEDEGIDDGLTTKGYPAPGENEMTSGSIRTLDGEIAGDELEGDAINYQILLGKIDSLLQRLKLDA